MITLKVTWVDIHYLGRLVDDKVATVDYAVEISPVCIRVVRLDIRRVDLVEGTVTE